MAPQQNGSQASVIPKDFENWAFVLHGVNDARFEKYPNPPEPGPKDVLIRSLSTGICGSDLHYWKDMALGNIKITSPIVLGHEASGIVVSVGSEVKNFKPGDRVCYEPAVTCLKCEYCKRSEFNLCVEATSKCPPYNGSLTYYFNHPEQFTFKIPDNLSAEEGAMIEPLVVAVYAAKRGDLTVGDHLLILGSGPIGLLMIMVGQVYGCTRIVITDVKEERLKLAKELGAHETILVDPKWSEEKTLEEILKRFPNGNPNKTYECSGVASNFRMSMLACKTNGLVVFVGMGPTEIQLPVANAANREVTIKSVHRYKGCFPLAIELASAKKFDLTKLITHRYELKDSQKAFEMAASGNGVKVMIKVGNDIK